MNDYYDDDYITKRFVIIMGVGMFLILSGTLFLADFLFHLNSMYYNAFAKTAMVLAYAFASACLLVFFIKKYSKITFDNKGNKK